MSHMVMFRSADGKAGYHQTESLDEAVAFVERLRNQEQVPDGRIFRMEEIPIEVKTYYKVEVASGAAHASQPPVAATAPAPSTTPTPASPSGSGPAPATSVAAKKVTVPAEEPVVVEPMGSAGSGPNGARFGRFNRS